MTILDRIRRIASRRGNEAGLRFEDRRFTLADLEGGSNAAARVLRAHGVRKGDRVVLCAATSLEGVLTHLGALKIGAISVPTNPDFRDAELAWVLEDSEPTVVVCDTPRLARCARLAPASVRAALEIVRGEGARPEGSSLPVHPLYEGIRKASVHMVDELVWDTDPAMILYTSGTTGRAKGARLDHGNLDANIGALVTAFGWTERDRLVLSLPLFHVHGLCVGLHGALVTGTETVILPRFDAVEVLRTLEQERATMFLGVPTMLRRMCEAAGDSSPDLSSMRLFVSGSAPLPPAVGAAFEERFGHRPLERYGMTETLITIAQALDGPRTFGTVGAPVTGMEARVEGPDGEPGELQLRGTSVGPGYWRNEAATREAFTDDGWFRSGDVATRDDDGVFRIVGRSKEMILTGGMNVYPREVEDALQSHDDVAEAAVFGIADDDLGEAVCAAVVAREGAALDPASLIEFCRERLAGYKKPRSIRVVDALPKNAMGKVLRHELGA